ncbi:MAG: EAL domain-containing protein [Ruminococcaceae bacterium]|nr:EAL domain-containing protein [Oscillospiraceae bacterium]
MEIILCSERFRKFYDNVERSGLPMEALTDPIRAELVHIAPDLHLGTMLCELSSPPMPYNEKGVTLTKELYISKNGCSESTVRNEYSTGDNGVAVITSRAESGYEWNEDEKAQIGFLHRCLYVLFGRARLTEILRNSLSTDALTKLPNTMGFLAIGNELFGQNKLHEYTAMYFNLKNFRCVNSQIGSKNGDIAIKAYAAALHEKLHMGEFAARLGGDNFTLLIRKERTDEMISYLKNALIEVALESSVIPFTIGAHIGVYYIQQGDKMPFVMNCISTAASNARRSPTADAVTFTPEIMQKLQREHTLTAAFPTALKDREFMVYYQPKVDLNTSRMCGCEALVRWKRDGAIIPPMEFIPLFERDGNVCALDFYMLENVCRDINEWIKQGLEPVTVSVNFSKTHLHNPNIAQDILSVIRKYNIDTRYIEIELTEMSDFSDYNAFKALVSEMKHNGVVTSIDDFGTGYSSLNLLTDFMFDVVKLDKSFLDNIMRSHSKTDEIVVRNIINMVNELGMKAIAEGVETVEQAKLLKDIGCTMVQGYLYDRPMCGEDFLKRLAAKDYEKKL